jgi:predicted metalloprotease
VFVRGRRILLLVALASTAWLLAGCGDAGPSGSGDEPAAAGRVAGQCGGRATDLAGALRIVTDPTGCPGAVNTFWRSQLGDAWTPPRIVQYRNGEVPAVACATADPDPDQFANNALYCPADDSVAFSVEFMNELAAMDPNYPLYVLLHELGHRADRIAGTVGVVSRAEENQADCLTGLQVNAAEDAERLDLLDAFQGAVLFFSLGDARGGWFDREAAAAPDAHGTPRQRAQAFGFGYLRDLDYCNGLGRSPTGSVPLF